MSTDWNQSSTALPREGQQIQFVLDHRSVALEGTYTRSVFRTTWAEYDVDRVQSWRKLGLGCDPEAFLVGQKHGIPRTRVNYASRALLLAAGGGGVA